MRDNPLARRSALTWAKLGRRFLDKPHPQVPRHPGLCYAAEGDFDEGGGGVGRAVLDSPRPGRGAACTGTGCGTTGKSGRRGSDPGGHMSVVIGGGSARGGRYGLPSSSRLNRCRNRW